MKKIVFCGLLAIGFNFSSAKSVLFSVDLSTSTVSPNGVHLSGDFQQALGLGPNWDPGTLPMQLSSTAGIYTVHVNLPAFKKYEFRFVNGDQTYEAEFVPDESRVGWIGADYSDNRWVYVDSTATDTLKIGAIRFGENAPAGKKLLRFKVDLSDAPSISPNGIHVGTSYQNVQYSPTGIRLFSLNPYVFEIINYVDPGQVNYLFYNGNTALNNETVPAACQVSGKRSLTVSNDTVLPQICFSSCAACLTVGFNELDESGVALKLFPNPASERVWIEWNSTSDGVLQIFDLTGRNAAKPTVISGSSELDVSALQKGMYLIRLSEPSGQYQTKVLLVN